VFNYLTDIRLRPFGLPQISELLERALRTSSISFNTADRAFVAGLAGGHPYLLQLAGAALFDVIASNTALSDRHAEATRLFQEWSSPFFGEMWREMTTDARVAFIVLVLSTIGGKFTDGVLICRRNCLSGLAQS